MVRSKLTNQKNYISRNPNDVIYKMVVVVIKKQATEHTANDQWNRVLTKKILKFNFIH